LTFFFSKFNAFFLLAFRQIVCDLKHVHVSIDLGLFMRVKTIEAIKRWSWRYMRNGSFL